MLLEFRLYYPDGHITQHRWSYYIWRSELYPNMTEYERHTLGNYMYGLFQRQPIYLSQNHDMQMLKQLCRMHEDYVPRNMIPLRFIRDAFP